MTAPKAHDRALPLQIALVSRRYPPLIGGAERVLSYLARALAAEGAQVTVLSARSETTLPAFEEIPVPENPTGSLRVVRLDTSPLRVVGTWLYMRNLARWFRRNPVDLAYVSMLKHDAYAVLGAGQRFGFPVVLRPEGAGATGDVAWQKWGRGGKTIARRCRTASALVAISEAVEKELVDNGYPGDRIVRLPNGVPVPETSWKRPRDGARHHAVFVGRLAPEKGLNTLLESWPRVRSAFPRAKLTLIGEGPERPRLEAIRDSLDLGEAVALPGASENPGATLREADLFVLPSREEGMSIALLEAMALGIPCVASAIPGNLGLVVPGVHALTAPPDQPEALSQAIVAQWSDIDRADRMAEAGRRRVIDEFSIAAVARRHLDLFQHLLLKT